MTIFSEPTTPVSSRHWLGDMEADHYLYTSGVAGEAFFRALRDHGRLLASECPRCEKRYIPAFLYCWNCLERLDESYQQVDGKGIVETFTIIRIHDDGSSLTAPDIRALIRFENASNRLLHRLGEVSPEEVEIGMEVEAVLLAENERQGRITDILYFKPTT